MAKTAEDLIAALHAARERWLDLEEGKAVKIRRPPETQWPRLRVSGTEAFSACVVDWKGFTEADLGGDGSEKVTFDPALWAAASVDRMDWMAKVIDGVTEDIKAHAAKTEERRKN